MEETEEVEDTAAVGTDVGREVDLALVVDEEGGGGGVGGGDGVGEGTSLGSGGGGGVDGEGRVEDDVGGFEEGRRERRETVVDREVERRKWPWQRDVDLAEVV